MATLNFQHTRHFSGFRAKIDFFLSDYYYTLEAVSGVFLSRLFRQRSLRFWLITYVVVVGVLYIAGVCVIIDSQ